MDPALWELLKTGGDKHTEEVEAIIRLDDPQVEIAGVRIVSRFGPIATCRLKRNSILATRDEENVRSLKAPRLLSPEVEPEGMNARLKLPPMALPSDVRRPPGLSLTGAGVVIGIIDWGCDFDHPHFKHPDGSTRLIALWDQRGSPHAHSYYGYGTVHSKRRINRALTSANPYRALGYHPADADPSGFGAHGTHVMGIAAGNGLGGGPIGMAPEADMICVHLANKGTGGLANLGDSVRIFEALDFVARTAGRRPWVVNFSVGRHGGPHDGSTLAEMAFDFALQDAPGRFIVQSTGNYFDKNIHSSGRLQKGQARTLSLMVDEADLTPNELEVWYAGGDEFAVRTKSPTGVISPWVKLGEQADVIENGRIAGRIYNRASDPNNSDNHLDLFLYPSAPPGVWKVTLKAERISSGGVFHAWLERDEACPGCQTRFSKFDSDSFYTTGTLANSRIPLVIGAYNSHSPAREVAPFSSAGPTRDNRPKPDLVAPGVGVLAARSAPHDGRTSPGTLVRKSGTSMAAPHVTGTVALCLQGARRPLWSHEIRELILNNAEPVAAQDQHTHRFGRGYLDVARVVEAVLALPPRVTTSSVYSYTSIKEHPCCSKERKMNGKLDEYFDRLEQVIKESTSRAVSERDLLAEIMRTTGVPFYSNSLDPDKLYQALAFSRNGSLPAKIGESFAVLARPGESPERSPQAGDLLLRVALGEPGYGHVAVLSDSTLWPHKQLANAPCRPESQQPGFYATVIEGGAFPHTHSDRFARRILDSESRMLPGQLLIRPRLAIELDLEEFLPVLCDAEGSEAEEEVDEKTELPTDPADGWVVPEDVRRAGEAQDVRYDDAPPWDASRRNCTGRLSDGARVLGTYLKDSFPGIREVGGYNCRPNTASPHKVSIHGTGRALDIMIPTVDGGANNAVGDPIVNWLVLNASAIGIQYLIWNRVRWSGHQRRRKFARYTGPNPHRDHIHAELNLDGAQRRTPWFAGRVMPTERGGATTLDYDKAIRLNRQYGRELRWQTRLRDIARFLGLASDTPEERDFVDAVARWQRQQGLGVDGILGPGTWARMEPALAVPAQPSTAGTSPPAQGQTVDWAQVSEDQRILYVMRRLVQMYRFPENGAAGLVGNLRAESAVLPNRVEGSSANAPMRAHDFNNRITNFTAEQVMNRNEQQRQGPRLPGIGLAQWTSPRRRSGLFQHRYGGRQLGAAILFDMDAQIDYLINELQNDFPGVYRILMNPNVRLEEATDEVVYDFERPGAILTTTTPRRRLPRTDARVESVFARRRGFARRALDIFQRASTTQTTTPSTSTAPVSEPGVVSSTALR